MLYFSVFLKKNYSILLKMMLQGVQNYFYVQKNYLKSGLKKIFKVKLYQE